MNIVILCNKDIASHYALNLLLPTLNDHQLFVYLSSKIGKAGKKAPALEALSQFEDERLSQLSSPSENNNSSACKSFEQLSVYLCQPVQELNAINSVEGISKIKSHAPDLIVSIRYGCILKQEIIKIPTHGILNLHSGVLPNYRGVMATFWAMLNDEQEIGTTLHFIDDNNIDTGRIISRSQFKVDKNKSYLWHVLQLYNSGVTLITNTVTQLKNNESIKTYRQPNSGNYYSFPNEKALTEFSEKGFVLFNEQDI